LSQNLNDFNYDFTPKNTSRQEKIKITFDVMKIKMMIFFLLQNLTVIDVKSQNKVILIFG